MQNFENLFNSLKERHEIIEVGVSDSPSSYRALSFEALYTSFNDLSAMFHHPLVTGDFVDLGSGIGLPVLLYASLFPERKSFGVEFERERVSVSVSLKKELALQNVEFFHADLLFAQIPRGDTYFLYFPTGPILDRILCELFNKDHSFNLLVIESHGDLIKRVEKENWLVLEDEIPLSSKRHFDRARLYRRIFAQRDHQLKPFDLSFEKKYLLLSEGEEEWIGESFGMEWVLEKRFELLVPPRTISWDKVLRILSLDDFTPLGQLFLELRKRGELEIITKDKMLYGFIRKIFSSPKLTIEISSGEKLQWSDIIKIYQDSVLCLDASCFPSSSLLVL
jgi:hypothetical protein